MDNKQLIKNYIELVWNQGKIAELPNFVTGDFVDHSLPNGFPTDASGTQKWIAATGRSFEHRTAIEEILIDGNKVFIRISMRFKHIGQWRGYEASGIIVQTYGYRLFELNDHRIAQQWALIDGTRIEEAISGQAHACRLT